MPCRLTGLMLCSLATAAAAQDWRGEKEALAGAGVYVRPAYEGAGTMRTDPVPMLRLVGEHWFARTTQGLFEGGYRVGVTSTLTAGVQLSYDAGRRTKDSAFLISRAVPTRDLGAAAGAHLEWNDRVGPAPVSGLLRWRQNLDTDQGAKVDARLTVGVLDTGHHRLGVFTQLTWASEKANQSYFGVAAPEAAATGLRAYSAGAGLRDGAVGLLGAYDLSRHWVALWSVEWHRVLGDARDSPYTRQAGNTYVSAGIAYRF